MVHPYSNPVEEKEDTSVTGHLAPLLSRRRRGRAVERIRARPLFEDRLEPLRHLRHHLLGEQVQGVLDLAVGHTVLDRFDLRR